MSLRKVFRFRIGTVFIAIAVFALLLAIVPRIWWRWHVDSALETTVANGPDFDWQFNPPATPTKDDIAYLLSDHQRVLSRLLAIATSDSSSERRVNALKTMQVLSSRSGSFAVRRQLLPQLITHACESDVSRPVPHEVMAIIKDWIPTTGVTIDERARMLRKAQDATGDERIGWIAVLAAMGGRQEVELLLRIGDAQDPVEFRALYNSDFRSITWPGMLPHLEKWINAPKIADMALEFAALRQTPAGRELLLKLVSDNSQPADMRIKAIERLK